VAYDDVTCRLRVREKRLRIVTRRSALKQRAAARSVLQFRSDAGACGSGGSAVEPSVPFRHATLLF